MNVMGTTSGTSCIRPPTGDEPAHPNGAQADELAELARSWTLRIGSTALLVRPSSTSRRWRSCTGAARPARCSTATAAAAGRRQWRRAVAAAQRLMVEVGRTRMVPDIDMHLHTYLPDSARLGLGAVRQRLAG